MLKRLHKACWHPHDKYQSYQSCSFVNRGTIQLVSGCDIARKSLPRYDFFFFVVFNHECRLASYSLQNFGYQLHHYLASFLGVILQEKAYHDMIFFFLWFNHECRLTCSTVKSYPLQNFNVNYITICFSLYRVPSFWTSGARDQTRFSLWGMWLSWQPRDHLSLCLMPNRLNSWESLTSFHPHSF